MSASDRVIGGGFGTVIEARFEEIVGAARDVIARRGYAQASIREIARGAGLSLAGLYHYVGGKEEVLFLVLDRALDRLLGALEAALDGAGDPETKLLALVRTHLELGLRDPASLKIVNRDHELLGQPRRSEIAAKRQAYLRRAMAVLRDVDRHGRSGEELLSATNLLLGMLNGIATRPFLRSAEDAGALAAEVTTLFLYGFLERPAHPAGIPSGLSGGEHDA